MGDTVKATLQGARRDPTLWHNQPRL